MIKNNRLYKLVNLITIQFFLFFSFQLSGCSTSSNLKSSNINSEKDTAKIIAQTELDRNLLLWEKSKIENYDFVCNLKGGGMYPWVPVLIKVRNGKVISREPAREKLELERVDTYEDFQTVEKMFHQIIQKGYDENFLVNVEYNKNLGYPVIINMNNRKISHSSIEFEIDKFEIIKAD